MAKEKRFKADHSYEIGVLKSGARLDTDTPQFIRSGGLGPKTVLGSQLIERGVETLEDFFKKNPFGAPTRKTFHIYEIAPDGMERTPFGAATIMPEENDSVEHSLGDDEQQPTEEPRVALFERPAPRYDATNDVLDTLRGQLATRDQQIDSLVRIAEQAMMQTERSMERVTEMLEHVQRTSEDRERIARESAENGVTIKNLLELRERENEWQKREKELEDAARERERALEKQVEEKSKSTLGDSVQTFLSDYSQYLGPALQHLMLSLAKSMTGQQGMQQGGGMMPGGMPGMGMPMMPGGGMPGMGIPGMGMPGMTHTPHQPTNSSQPVADEAEMF